MGKKESDLVSRLIPMIAAWGIGKLLETEPLKASVRSADRSVRRRTTDALGEARQNALDNGVWLAAGVVALAIGVGLIVRATRPR
jgi:hypothetical protein